MSKATLFLPIMGGYLTRGLVYSEMKRDKEADADFIEACRLGSNDGCRFAGK